MKHRTLGDFHATTIGVSMAKQGEIEYLETIGEDGRRHAAGKPFSDQECGLYLARFGQVMAHLPPPPARILDLGCGTGWTSAFLAQRGYDVVGVDIAPDMIEIAKQAAEDLKLTQLEFIVGDYESVGFEDEFDGAVFFDSLHHAEDERAALSCAYRALRPGGICVVSEPGVGHHETPESKLAIESFNVTEKDMPPQLVISLARDIGFSQSRTYLHQGQIFALFNHDYSSRRQGLLGWLLRRRILRPLIPHLAILRMRGRSGVVILTR